MCFSFETGDFLQESLLFNYLLQYSQPPHNYVCNMVLEHLYLSPMTYCRRYERRKITIAYNAGDEKKQKTKNN